ncbi:hypothetical protein [Streptomyces sp. NPDC002221]|uniref:hypothetical protein n=1 Tax=Streptomyces sp. NPDC002221 TaxID=3364639 RepID=UPI0036870C6F
MTTRGKMSARLGILPLSAVLLLLGTACGTQRAGDAAGPNPDAHVTPTGVTQPSAPVDSPCPGESAKPSVPSATASASSTVPPTDHYAENHGFRVPIPLHGQSRCDGLAVVSRVTKALEPLRRRGDFVPDHAHDALTGLGYSAAKVQAYEDGPTGVGFLIDLGASPWCVEGTMSRDATKADAFAGYPDGSACQPPKGGH